MEKKEREEPVQMERLERLNQMQSMDQMQTDDSETLGELESKQGCSSATPC